MQAACLWLLQCGLQHEVLEHGPKGFAGRHCMPACVHEETTVCARSCKHHAASCRNSTVLATKDMQSPDVRTNPLPRQRLGPEPANEDSKLDLPSYFFIMHCCMDQHGSLTEAKETINPAHPSDFVAKSLQALAQAMIRRGLLDRFHCTRTSNDAGAQTSFCQCQASDVEQKGTSKSHRTASS